MDVNFVNNCNNNKILSQNESIKLFILIGAKQKDERVCLQKFINLCMKNGKKNNSNKFLLSILKQLSFSRRIPIPTGPTPSGLDSLKSSQKSIGAQFRPARVFLLDAIANVKPIIEVKKVRISGTTQLVPSIIPKNRQLGLAIRWIIEAAIARRKAKKNLTLDQCFFAEIMDASQGIGAVKKKRDDLHKLAEANRGFAHYRWW